MSKQPITDEEYARLVADYGESSAEGIRRERLAIIRLDEALETIAGDLQWYWHWSDGEGGYVLDRLAKLVREKGYIWPGDTIVRQKSSKAKIARKLSKAVMERDAFRCVTCGTHVDLTCDHIIPESKGGATTFDNLQTMCRPCNSRKGARHPE